MHKPPRGTVLSSDHGAVSIDDVLARQAGVLALWQATACGMSAEAVQRRARDGAWRRLHPGVYLAGGHRHTDEARIRAAWLWGGPRTTVTGPAAAYWHGLVTRAPAVVDLTVPAATKPRPQPGIRTRRRDLSPAECVEVRGIRVAALPFAVLETAVVGPEGAAFLDRALQRHVGFPALYRAYCRNLGRTGSAAARHLLVAAADRADSAAERLLVALLRDAGIGGWVVGHPFGPYRIDVAFPAAMVAVEVDGWAWHVDVERFRADRRKGNALTGAGWHLLRFTWHVLHEEPATVLAEIVNALTRAA